jgi:hypothetical protein
VSRVPQTGVALATRKTHCEKWMPDPAGDELDQLGRAFGVVDACRVHDVDPKSLMWTPA